MNRRARGTGWLPTACAALLVSLATAAFAQPEAQPRRPASQTTRASSLSGRFTSAVALRLLRSADRDEQLRGIRRLGSQNDYSAVQLLLQAIEQDPGLTADPKLRLAAVRALSPFAPREPVRKLLATWAAATTLRGRSAGPMGTLASDQAALALSASSNNRAVEQLLLAVIDGGGAGERAAMALIAHPPRNIEPLLRASSLESAAVVEVLGEIGDLRAIPKLRRLLDEGNLDAKVASAVALATLGDPSGVKLANDWLAQDGSTHALRLGAARTLTLTRDPLAPRAIAVLLADPATRDDGLSLAERAPSPQLAPTLAGLLTIAHGEQRVRVLAALGRAGGPLAVKTLANLANQSPPDLDAVYALAQCRDPGAQAAVASMLSKPQTRRAGARAALIRIIERGESTDGLEHALATFAASQNDADRSVGVFGLVITHQTDVETYAKSKDRVSVLAACRAALGMSQAARRSCEAQLSGSSPAVLRDALAGTLLGAKPPGDVSTERLLSWSESTRVSAPIFGRALGPRDDDAFRTRIERLLASGDPDMRAQVAIGLGRSPDASAAALLTDAYAFETDPWVRRALVLGLAARQSAVGRRWLALAAQLDPDRQVRSLARHALSGSRFATPSQGRGVLWIRLSQTQAAQPASARPVRVVMSNGFATVAVTAPDGQALVPGLTPGYVRLRVAGEATMQQESRP